MEGHFFLQEVRHTYFCVLQFFQNNLICCHCQQCCCFWRHISPLTKCHYQGDPPRSYVTSHENRQTCNLISDMFLWATMSLTRRQQWKWPRRHSHSPTKQLIFNKPHKMTLLTDLRWHCSIANCNLSKLHFCKLSTFHNLHFCSFIPLYFYTFKIILIFLPISPLQIFHTFWKYLNVSQR